MCAMNMMVTRRNAAVESYRMFLMFGIVLLHVITQCGYCRRGLDNLLSSCVEGFVFISGYFGIRFSVRKVLKLLGTAVFCSAVVQVIDALVLSGNGGMECVQRVILRLNSPLYWFLWGYIALMMMAPLVEQALQSVSDVRRYLLTVFLPLCLLVYGWSYASMMTRFAVVNGFSSIGLLSLLMTYIVGRSYRLHFECRIAQCPLVWIICILILCALMCVVGFYHHNSIFAVGFVLCSFLLVRRCRVPSGWLAMTVVYLAPSMFSIYLLHTTDVGLRLSADLLKWCVETAGIPVYGSYFIVSGIAFVGCLCLDLIRRFLLSLIYFMGGRK